MKLVQTKIKKGNCIHELKNISEVVDVNELTKVTQEALSIMYGDPEEDSYYTPQQIKKITIQKMVEEGEIWGSLHSGNIVSLECDSDTYRLAINWTIDLNSKEVYIYE
jgi:hypothetical protein